MRSTDKQDINMNDTHENVFDYRRPELQRESARPGDGFVGKVIEFPQSVHDRIRCWLDDSERVQNESDSMVTLVPVVENPSKKTRNVSIRIGSQKPVFGQYAQY